MTTLVLIAIGYCLFLQAEEQRKNEVFFRYIERFKP